MYNPVSTYRLQFHKEFTFSDFERIIPYLQKLGVRTIYASPIFESTSGSTHGYDSVNPHRINPEIGTEEQLKEFSRQLKEEGIGWLQDIVPNHMAFDPSNPWLMDVLEKGPLSEYAAFFDAPWTATFFEDRIMVPFLGAPLEEVIRDGELSVVYEDDRLRLRYYDSVYPMHLRSYATVLQATNGPIPNAIRQLIDQVGMLHRIEDPKAYALEFAEFQQQFAALQKNEITQAYLEQCLEEINNSPDWLQQITDAQEYRLCYHGETDRTINFRRFFTVNGLICLNIQRPEVFAHFHLFIKALLEEGVFQGLRVDHIDGLFDPTGYLNDLRALTGDETYIVVEKILEPGEELPDYWPVQGTTGYDFLAVLNNVFTRQESEKPLTQLYHKLIRKRPSVPERITSKKTRILADYMGGEQTNLYRLFTELNLTDKQDLADLPTDALKNAIGEFLIQCPVYRYYGNQMPLGPEETEAVQEILDRVRTSKPDLGAAVDILQQTLLQKPTEGDDAYNRRALLFYQRCMQFTGPLMAKGVEDTLMYTYNRFVGHNEVGDSPETFGIAPEDFHQLMQERQAKWPLALNGTSTHDTKRGEDVRARLNVLTDLADEWKDAVQEWQGLNADLKQKGAPDANDEYFIYHTLIGAYPMPDSGDDDFAHRLDEYLEKALREAKRHSAWSEPDETYEEATKAFATGLLDPKKPFWASFQKLHQQVADFGIINSLAQVILKFACPGVPDVYQGCELWDLSLVDPDNRRPVDYAQRQQWLDELDQSQATPEDLLRTLWADRYDARIKLWLVHKLLQIRQQEVDVFTQGEYVPLEVEGACSENVLAFARRWEQTWCVVVVPLHLAHLAKQQQQEVMELDWQDTRVKLPEGAPSEWTNLFLNSSGSGEGSIPLNAIVKPLPFAILKL